MRRIACLGAMLRALPVAGAVLAMALSTSSARAGDDSGALQFLLQNSKPSSFPLFAPPRALQPAIPRYIPREPARSYSPRPAAPSDAGYDGPSASVSGGVICVRMCDGFYFPVVNGSMETRESICRATCPDAETKVFRGSRVENAVGDNGQRYGDLKVAFLYRTERVEGCTCRRDPGDRSKSMSVMRDPTLKAGDTIVTNEGAVVFTAGSKGPPFKLADFTPLQDARMLSQPARQKIASLLGLNRDTLTARVGRPLGPANAGTADAGDDDIPEITITRRGEAVASTTPVSVSEEDAAPTGKRVILPGPWATPR